MPLGSFTMIVVCAECGGSVDAAMHRNKIEVGMCQSCAVRYVRETYYKGRDASSEEV